MEKKLTKVIEMNEPDDLFIKAQSLLKGSMYLLRNCAEEEKEPVACERMYSILNIVEEAVQKLEYYEELTRG